MRRHFLADGDRVADSGGPAHPHHGNQDGGGDQNDGARRHDRSAREHQACRGDPGDDEAEHDAQERRPRSGQPRGGAEQEDRQREQILSSDRGQPDRRHEEQGIERSCGVDIGVERVEPDGAHDPHDRGHRLERTRPDFGQPIHRKRGDGSGADDRHPHCRPAPGGSSRATRSAATASIRPSIHMRARCRSPKSCESTK